MENNYDFWEVYLKKIKKEITKLCSDKEKLYIDFHMHSNYSADGKQSLKQILESTNNKGFDIISVTDHDSIDIYNELYEIVKDGSITNPIIIPGVEFTIDNKEYGNQCHLLQLFINPKDSLIETNIKINYDAMFNRSKIQFKRLKENITIQTFIRNEKIEISYEEYLKYLANNNLVPEYDTLCFYLIEKFKSKNISTFDILDLLEKNNKNDCYDDRKKYKELRYDKLRKKYDKIEKNYYNPRFLLSMLAVKEVDDDWWDKPNCGSLSVNSYGQMKIEQLNEKYKTFFAHPTENKLSVVKNIIKSKRNIIGLEMNIRNEYKNIKNFDDIIETLKLLKIIGSDSHDNSMSLYENMNYYLISSDKIIELIEKY